MFWKAHDPTRAAFSRQYMAAVFPDSDEQTAIATQTAHQFAPPDSIRTRIARKDRFYRAEDYHQKYRLRRDATLVEEVRNRYPTELAFVDSTLAARLNGYLSGRGSRARLADEVSRYALPLKLEQHLLAKVP